MPSVPPKIAYVVKRYPRYSETFIVNEILAHEAAGLSLEIFSLLPPVDTHFQDAISLVRAPVRYLPGDGPKAADFLRLLQEAVPIFPNFAETLAATGGEDVRDIHQAVALALTARRCNIVHLHAHFASSPATVARYAAKLAGIPFSFTAHAKDIFHEGVEAEDLRAKLAEAAAVVTVSDFNVTHLREQYGEAAARVRRVYNGLDLDRFSFTAPTQRPPRVVGIGRLIEKKGFSDLVAACDVLAKKGREFTCEIIGAGEDEAALRAQVEQLGLRDRVALLGPRPQSEIVEHLRGAAVFAAPCVIGADGNRDGLPTVLLEAMALGTPCVSTDVTGIPEVLYPGKTGLMVPQRDPAALASAIERLFDDPALRVRLAAQARQLIEAEFNVHANAARVRELFAPALAAAGAST
jgi:glycosyltransferase involved in cell wall biosynthesis